MCPKGEKEKPPASLISSQQPISLQVLKLSSSSYGDIRNICFATIYISLFLQTQTLAEFFLSLPVTKGEKLVTVKGNMGNMGEREFVHISGSSCTYQTGTINFDFFFP